MLPKEPEVAGRQHLADLVERELELAEPADRARLAQLVGPVAPVAGVAVDLGGPEQADLVVVPKGPDREAGEPREAPDRH